MASKENRGRGRDIRIQITVIFLLKQPKCLYSALDKQAFFLFSVIKRKKASFAGSISLSAFGVSFSSTPFGTATSEKENKSGKVKRVKVSRALKKKLNIFSS